MTYKQYSTNPKFIPILFDYVTEAESAAIYIAHSFINHAIKHNITMSPLYFNDNTQQHELYIPIEDIKRLCIYLEMDSILSEHKTLLSCITHSILTAYSKTAIGD